MRLAALALALFATTAHAGQRCDLALALSFDASGSMFEPEHRLMREGTAQALLSPKVAEAFERGIIWLHITEWAEKQVRLLDWTPIENREALERVAALVLDTPRQRAGQMTALGAALAYAATEFERAPPCDRMVLDVVGDGPSNDGPHPAMARTLLDPAVQVNGLLVSHDSAAEHQYRTVIQHGPGSFVLRVDGWEGFAAAIEQKLTFELFLSGLPRAGRS